MNGYAFTDKQMEKAESFFGESIQVDFDVSNVGGPKKRKNKITYTVKSDNSPIQISKEIGAKRSGYTVSLATEDGWEWYDYDSFDEMMKKARKIRENMDRYT